MATPTERVTRRAQEHLGDEHDVVLALRVEWGPDVVAARKRFTSGFWARAYLWTPVVLPILRLFRWREDREREDDPASGVGILALTADGGRVLLGASRFWRKVPTETIQLLPQGSPLVVDVELMETDMIPFVSVAHREFVVDGVDFRALLKAVAGFKLEAEEIREALPRLHAVGASPYTTLPEVPQ